MMTMMMGAAPNSNGSGRSGDDDLASTSSDSPNGNGDNMSRRDSTPLLASTRPPPTAATVHVELVSGTNGDPTPGETEEDSYAGGSSVRYRKKSADEVRSDAQRGKEYSVPKPHKDGSMNWCHRATMFGQLVLRYCRMNEQSRGPKSLNDWVATFLPCWRWLQVYQWKSTLWKDVIAGLTVGIMVIPQGMSYAKLAGLPVQYGLYSALVPLYVYAVFGSSRHLSVGPVAITSLLLSSGLTKVLEEEGLPVDDPNYETRYIQLAIQTSLLVGLVYVGMAVLGLGFITLFLSHAVISGFTSGAAIIIALSQVKYIFGYSVPRSDTIYGNIINLFDNISQFNYKTFLLGMGSLAVLIGFKKLGAKYKALWFLKTIGPLAVSVFGIVLVAAFGLQDKGIPIVGEIPQGFPPVTAGLWFPISDVGNLIEVVVTITLVGLMESIAIARQLAKRHEYKINPSMELYGLGLSNLASALFSGYPTTGSFSRSAVNSEAGAKTQVSSAVAATLVGLVLLFLTSVFELLPTCIIGAIIISGVVSLVDYPEAVRLWRFDMFDFCVWMITFLGVFFLGAELGLLCGVVLSFVQVLAQSALPRIRILGRLPGTNAYRSITQYPQAESYPGCLVTSTDSPLYFLNAQLVKDRVLRRSVEMDAETGTFTRYIVLDLTSVSDVDTCALHELDDWLVELAASGGAATVSTTDGGPPSSSRGRQLLLANPNSTVMSRMDEWGFIERLGRGHCFSRVHDAVAWALAKLEEAEGEEAQGLDRGGSDVANFYIGEPAILDGADGTQEGVEMPAVGARLSPQTDFSILEDGLHHRRTSASPSEGGSTAAPATTRPTSRTQTPPRSGQGPSAWIGR